MTPILFFIASLCTPGPSEPICQDAVRPFACLEVLMDDGQLALGCAWYDDRDAASMTRPSREVYMGATFYAADWPTLIQAAERGTPIPPAGGAVNCMPLRDTLFCEHSIGGGL